MLKSALKIKQSTDPIKSAQEWADELDQMGKKDPIGFTSAYVGLLVTQCLGKHSDVNVLTNLLDRKAEILNNIHVDKLLKIACEQKLATDAAALVNLLDKKALGLEEKNVGQLINLNLGQADKRTLTRLLSKKGPRLQGYHKAELKKLGIFLD